VLGSSGSELDELSNYELLTLLYEFGCVCVCVCVCVLPYLIQTRITLFRYCGYVKCVTYTFLGHSNGTGHRICGVVGDIH
jgi:hypothetical protein